MTKFQGNTHLSIANKFNLSHSCATAVSLGRARQGVSPLYVDLEQVVPIIVGERCLPGASRHLSSCDRCSKPTAPNLP